MPLLNWHEHQHFDHTGSRPCALCGKPTPLRSHDGEPVHKVCAEDWNDQHRDVPGHFYLNHDHGTVRFHSDPPKKRKS
ncbi:hypothetical protein [Streptomyces sp. NPDC048425]|uniref:hypothetical protein n=1 Tax=Streptomyces sp. NPDC048425 TaxID=3365548 RepID=UPI00371D6692